jgi:Uma2 family endonuclease
MEARPMSTNRLTFHEFLQLPEEPGKHYELNQGELVMEPSPTWRHNVIRGRIEKLLGSFVKTHGLGSVSVENDFRLGPDIVRNPDVAFVTSEQLNMYDMDRSPIEGTPTLAVEVISPNNSAEAMLLKVHQYLSAGCKAVWVAYPVLRLVAVHTAEGMHEFRGHLEEAELFGGRKFSLDLEYVFDLDLTK